jgi:CDP-glucose 4,6-dehydratase
VVFHLAAQPLVRDSYRDALGTFATNVMGTANLLEAMRGVDSIRAAVLITTDKVYLNREHTQPYRETDHLGGHDPYSASKAATEIVAASYRASFFTGPDAHPARIATARAGNVIGGGDWAADRLVPDCLRSFAAGEPVRLRYPDAVRPWQHVLDPLAGYLQLAQHLLSPEGHRFARAWNFGPDAGSEATVLAVAQALARLWGDGAVAESIAAPGHPHEASLLHLDSSAAHDALGWRPRWHLERALEKTVAWQLAMHHGDDMAAVSLEQIRTQMKLAGQVCTQHASAESGK